VRGIAPRAPDAFSSGGGRAGALAAALTQTAPTAAAAKGTDEPAGAGTDEAIHWGTATHTFPALVPLAAAAEWRAAIVEGLVVSVGGLDPALSKVAAAALVRHLRSPGPPAAVAAAAAEVAAALLRVAQRHAAADRVMVPWLRTLDVLCHANCLLPPLAADHPFPAAVLEVRVGCESCVLGA
jgi:hypothetical protein